MSGPFPEFVMKEKCETCAFRVGTPANLSGITQAKAKLCIESRIPFYCHWNEGEDGKLPKDQSILCRGFVDALTIRLNNGSYENEPEWWNDVRVELLQVIEDYEEQAADGSAPSEAQLEHMIMSALARLHAEKAGIGL